MPDSSTGVIINNGGAAFIDTPSATSDYIWLGLFADRFTPGGNGTLLLNANSGSPGIFTTGEISVGRVDFDQPPATIMGNLTITAGAVVHVTKGAPVTGYGVAIR